MGNKSKCNSIGRGTILSQRESSKPIPIHDVLHMLGMGMNLISIFILQYKAYNVLFRGYKVFIKC